MVESHEGFTKYRFEVSNDETRDSCGNSGSLISVSIACSIYLKNEIFVSV